MAGRTEAASDGANTRALPNKANRALRFPMCVRASRLLNALRSLIHDLESGAGLGHRFARFLALVPRYTESGGMDHVLKGLLIGPAPQASRIERMQIN